MERRPWDQDERYIEERISWTIRGLLDKFGFGKSDRKDLEQDFRLDVLVRLRSYDPDRAHRRTFISRIIANKAATLIESQKAQKRNFTKTRFSLNEEVAGPDGDPSTRMEQMEVQDYKHRVFDRFICTQPRHDLTIDLSVVLPGLSAEHRLICELLSRGDRVAEVARRLRCSRATVYAGIEKVHQRFVREGLSP